jgi:hypothetical protein
MKEKEYLDFLKEKISETVELMDFLANIAYKKELNLPSGYLCDWTFSEFTEDIYIETIETTDEDVVLGKVDENFVCYISTLCWHYFIAKDFEEVKNGLQNLPKLPGPGVAFLIDGGTSLFEAATKIDFSDFLKNN